MFRPVPQVEAVIGKRVAAFSAYTVGVHIRRTDNALSIEHSPLDLFFDCLDQELAAHSDLCIYLATDSEEVKQAMRARYGERIVCAESKADRSTTEGIREGIADLWTLARTQKIYGSFHSSFSELAADTLENGYEIINNEQLRVNNDRLKSVQSVMKSITPRNPLLTSA